MHSATVGIPRTRVGRTLLSAAFDFALELGAVRKQGDEVQIARPVIMLERVEGNLGLENRDTWGTQQFDIN